MDPFSYLSYLTSIVLALGIARILTGFGKLLQVRGRVRIYWIHVLWALNVFLYLVLIWWILYRWQSQQEWTFFLFLFILLSPTVAFLESVLLFPDALEEGTDFKQHFFSNHRWFFRLVGGIYFFARRLAAAFLPAAFLAAVFLADAFLRAGARFRETFLAAAFFGALSALILAIGTAISAEKSLPVPRYVSTGSPASR